MVGDAGLAGSGGAVSAGLADGVASALVFVVGGGFGMVWRDADNAERAVLAGEEPEPFDPRWDAFLAACIEHLCRSSGLDAPEWTRRPGRYLQRMWWSAPYFDFERGRVVVTTPTAFEAHGVWIAERDLLVV